jgi:hypothetical protein
MGKLLSLFLLVSLLLALGALVWGKPMVQTVTTTHELRSALRLVANLAQEPKHYQECQQLSESDIFAIKRYPLVAYQLRFTSPTAFVVEAVCSGSSKPTVEVNSKILPSGSHVVAGTGVEVPIKTEPEDAQFVVVVGEEVMTYGFKDGEVFSSESEAHYELATGEQPQTTCEGVGLVCCDAQKQVGLGEQQTNVSNCPQTCFASCMNRPQVTLFNSDPPATSLDRQVDLTRSNSTLRISYRIDDPDNTIGSVDVDWGDGEGVSGLPAKHTLDHTYTCLSQQCAYRVVLSAQDTTGLDLLDGRLNWLEVRVK